MCCNCCLARVCFKRPITNDPVMGPEPQTSQRGKEGARAIVTFLKKERLEPVVATTIFMFGNSIFNRTGDHERAQNAHKMHVNASKPLAEA